MRIPRGLSLVLVLVLVACSSSPPRRPPSGIPRGDYAYLAIRTDYEAKRAMQEQNAAGFAIAVVDADRVVYEAGHGMADLERATLVEPDTFFQIGSVTKLFTAIAVMQLVEQGKVELDAPVSRYLPELATTAPLAGASSSWTKDAITIRALLAHQSGIIGDVYHRMFADPPRTDRETLDVIAAEPAAQDAWRAHAYANVGFSLLGVVVERASGMPYARYIEERVLAPTGMTESRFVPTPQIRAKLAQPHRKGRVEDAKPLGMLAAGGLYSSVEELSRFLMMLAKKGEVAGGRVLTAASFDEMWRRQNGEVALDFDLAQGLAFALHPSTVEGRGLVVGHEGATLHHRAALLVNVEHGLGAVVLTSSYEGKTGKLCADALALAAETKTGVVVPAPDAQPKEMDDVDAEWLDSLVGTYDTDVGVVRFARDDDVLFASVFGERLELVPLVDQSFAVRVKLFRFIPFVPTALAGLTLRVVDVGETRALVAGRAPETALYGTRIAPPAPSDAWIARAGAYDFVDVDGEDLIFDGARVAHTDGLLTFALHVRTDDVWLPKALVVVDDDRAVIAGIGRARGEIVRAAADGALTWSGYRMVAKAKR